MEHSSTELSGQCSPEHSISGGAGPLKMVVPRSFSFAMCATPCQQDTDATISVKIISNTTLSTGAVFLGAMIVHTLPGPPWRAVLASAYTTVC